MKFFWVKTVLFLVCFFSVERFCHDKTQGFSLNKIKSNLPHHTEWETEPPSEESAHHIHAILSQPYYFLDSGGESYVFLSKDGNYILKFFKHHHMRPKSTLDHFLPRLFREKYRAFRMNRLSRLFTSCKLAFDHFKKRTGLVYLHLNPTDHLKIRLKIFDPIRIVHYLNLDQFTFVLQKRAVKAFDSLSYLIEAKELDPAKERLESLLDLMIERSQAGLVDHDARKRNFGFIGSEAIEWDIGSFTLDEKLKNPTSIQRAFLFESSRIRRWIKKYTPDLIEPFDKKLSACMEIYKLPNTDTLNSEDSF